MQDVLGFIGLILLAGIYARAVWVVMTPRGVDEAAAIRARADDEFIAYMKHAERRARRRHHMRED